MQQHPHLGRFQGFAQEAGDAPGHALELNLQAQTLDVAVQVASESKL
jgi:hypothetical protein